MTARTLLKPQNMYSHLKSDIIVGMLKKTVVLIPSTGCMLLFCRKHRGIQFQFSEIASYAVTHFKMIIHDLVKFCFECKAVCWNEPGISLYVKCNSTAVYNNRESPKANIITRYLMIMVWLQSSAS